MSRRDLPSCLSASTAPDVRGDVAGVRRASDLSPLEAATATMEAHVDGWPTLGIAACPSCKPAMEHFDRGIVCVGMMCPDGRAVLDEILAMHRAADAALAKLDAQAVSR